MPLMTPTGGRVPGRPTPLPGGGYRLTPTSPIPTAPAPPDPYGPDPTGTAKEQADQLAHPTQVDIKTAPNPYQTEAFGDVKKYAESLANRSNESITNAMQRTRDVGSANIADVTAQAGRRGGGPGSGLSGVLASRAASESARQVAKTNADLTDVALGREAQARALEMGGATDIARDQSDMFGKQADLYLGGRRADLDRADFYGRERDRRFERAKEIADLAIDTGGGYMGGGGAIGGFRPGGLNPVRPLGGTLGGRQGVYPSAVSTSPYLGLN